MIPTTPSQRERKEDDDVDLVIKAWDEQLRLIGSTLGPSNEATIQFAKPSASVSPLEEAC
jgi:hypothetical protein